MTRIRACVLVRFMAGKAGQSVVTLLEAGTHLEAVRLESGGSTGLASDKGDVVHRTMAPPTQRVNSRTAHMRQLLYLQVRRAAYAGGRHMLAARAMAQLASDAEESGLGHCRICRDGDGM